MLYAKNAVVFHRGSGHSKTACPLVISSEARNRSKQESFFDRGQDFSSLTLVEMTVLALIAVTLQALVELTPLGLVEMTFHSTLKEPLDNARCFTDLFSYSSAVNGCRMLYAENESALFVAGECHAKVKSGNGTIRPPSRAD